MAILKVLEVNASANLRCHSEERSDEESFRKRSLTFVRDDNSIEEYSLNFMPLTETACGSFRSLRPRAG